MIFGTDSPDNLRDIPEYIFCAAAIVWIISEIIRTMSESEMDYLAQNCPVSLRSDIVRENNNPGNPNFKPGTPNIYIYIYMYMLEI